MSGLGSCTASVADWEGGREESRHQCPGDLRPGPPYEALLKGQGGFWGKSVQICPQHISVLPPPLQFYSNIHYTLLLNSSPCFPSIASAIEINAPWHHVHENKLPAACLCEKNVQKSTSVQTLFNLVYRYILTFKYFRNYWTVCLTGSGYKQCVWKINRTKPSTGAFALKAITWGLSLVWCNGNKPDWICSQRSLSHWHQSTEVDLLNCFHIKLFMKSAWGKRLLSLSALEYRLSLFGLLLWSANGQDTTRSGCTSWEHLFICYVIQGALTKNHSEVKEARGWILMQSGKGFIFPSAY